jgi:hypothetical protein
MTPTAPDATAALASTVRTWIPIAISVGTGIGSIVVAMAIGIYKFVKSQTMNGDGRSLRKALDDMALDLQEHRHEMRSEIGDIKQRVSNLEYKSTSYV